ncbi:MAG: hypothetical protein QF632_05125 [Candidatus Woesearchaeota archaeon]|jgi:hypothetical protein|nr:hypothetical protein [Candidatus Woesearchaeota archaeon]MDP7324113.1 hypothetical protein [Candidatus Woesearchaeota archaeon]MDP7457169.1 hypothetical protein [Candidatus Woesearchaeota archaeon]|tara:strand:- start:104 stop:454 length:351 start_codon:yes stop_codon:yes gene_type:complete
MDKKVGHYSFIVGVIVAIVLGLVSLGSATPWLSSLLVVLGLIVGFINVTGKETREFLLVSAVLIIAAGLGGVTTTLGAVEVIGPYLSGIFTKILAFVVPATVVVALKDIWCLGQIE